MSYAERHAIVTSACLLRGCDRAMFHPCNVHHMQRSFSGAAKGEAAKVDRRGGDWSDCGFDCCVLWRLEIHETRGWHTKGGIDTPLNPRYWSFFLYSKA